PLRCPVASECTEPIWSGANQWRLCEGGGQGVCATTKGRLEVRHEETWQPVCQNNFWTSWPNLLPACRMFGFQHSVATAEFGDFNGPTYIPDLECTGSELTLAQCQFQYTPSSCMLGIGIICTNQCTSTI
ncbi:LG3BP-like protein, partial [Mya arenaria]